MKIKTTGNSSPYSVAVSGLSQPGSATQFQTVTENSNLYSVAVSRSSNPVGYSVPGSK